MKKIGFIGCGNMGGTLAKVANDSGNSLLLADKDEGKLSALCGELNAKASVNEEIARECDVIFLGVKPQILSSVLSSVKSILAERSDRFLLISMAAGVDTSSVFAILGKEYPLIRIMPNTPAAVGGGVILYSAAGGADTADTSLFKEIMKTAGICDELPESLINAASAVSGCGSAFVYMFIQSLADGAVKCGLPRDKALKYAAATVMGSAKAVLELNTHPEALKDAVCSPAGSTIEGVNALEQSGFRGACIEAVSAAYKRTVELGK